jgi:adenosylhomocysteinase
MSALESTDFRVKDPMLAQQGREAIRAAEREMPGLMALRERWAGARPLAGARISGSLHMTAETAVLIETLRALGAEVRWCSCNIFSTHDAAAAALAAAQVPVFAWKGETLDEYWWCLDRALTFPDGQGPDLLVDDGGDATWWMHEGARAEVEAVRLERPGTSEDERAGLRLLKKKRSTAPRFFTEAIARLRGISEETTAGVRRLQAMNAHGELRVAAIDVNNSVTKTKFDNIYGSRESLIDALNRATHRMLAGKRAVVCGYGDVGKGCAEALAAHRARVFVTEIDPVCALQALMAGHEVVRLEEVLPSADIAVTATGNRDVVTLDHLQRLKDGAVVCNIGHFDCEIQIEALNAAPSVKRTRIAPQVDRYTFPDGRSIVVLAEGRLVNLACAEGHPAFVMSCSFSNQVLAQIDLWRERRTIGIHRLPKTLDEEVARLHVEALGGRLTRLTGAQAEHLAVPVDGPFKAADYRY